MEGGWTQFLIGRFEDVKDGEIMALIQQKEKIHTEVGARNFLKSLLNKAIERVGVSRQFPTNLLRLTFSQRFLPLSRVEKYWSEKPAKFGVLDLDVEVRQLVLLYFKADLS